MKISSGMDIVELHRDYEAKINELETTISRLEGFGYTKSVLEDQLIRLRDERKQLETTRFQPLEPVTVSTSTLGGHDHFIS